MIPYGQNPMGLETRPIKYIVRYNGHPSSLEISWGWNGRGKSNEEVVPTTVQDRMFCYVTFPEELVNEYGAQWAIWDTTKPLDNRCPKNEREWITWPKKYSRDNLDHQKPEERIMIEQEFSSQTPLILFTDIWEDTTRPAYGTVFVLDTSGSMGGEDYDKAKKSITMSVINAASKDLVAGSKIWVYPGTYIENIQQDKSNYFAKLNLAGWTVPLPGGGERAPLPSEVHPLSSSLVDGIRKNGSSEAMVTCMYFAMDDVMHELKLDVTSGEDYYDPYDNDRIQGMCFIMLTDESVITTDTLDGITKMKRESRWWAKFNDTANGKHKFPTGLNDDGNAMSAKKFCGRINNGCIELSYYWGINITWAMTTMLSTAGDINQLKVSSDKPGVIPFTGTANDDGSVANKPWYMPSEYHVTYPYEPMSMIVLQDTTCPGARDDITLKNMKGSQAEGNRSYVSVRDVFRSRTDPNLGNVVFCFRYFEKDSFVLPNTSTVNCDGVSLYKWGRLGRDGAVKEVYWPDAVYVPQKSHTRKANGRRIIFKPMKKITVKFCRCETGEGDGSTVQGDYVASYDTVYAPADPARAGFTFGGWYTGRDGTGSNDGIRWNNGKKYENDKTFYAKWTAVTPA